MTAPELTQYVQGQGSVSADGLNTFEQTTNIIADLRSFVGVTGMQVICRGQASVNDGGGGSFYWNALGTGPDDGVNTIVPFGAATGVWSRLIFAGSIGQFLSSTVLIGGAVPLSNGLINDITVLTLTPGDWDVWGNIAYTPTGGTVATLLLGWLNTVSLGQPVYPNGGAASSLPSLSPGTGNLMFVGMRRYNVTVNTSIFLSTFASFTVGTLLAYGFIGARKMG